ncbi:ABC transporter ATP-binding protein [Rhodococcus sp. CX]|uniref:ABC transporter ATP-binding protein n=1 Tax=Rhodococcus sp. CX TaxID=2789880 RepID=UPI0018CF9129|nr:ABC transporter ATP-binding protein [Rhodococcus sp. CX]MBH0122080.1 ABC transporter ATP-binding protein [Rhodococcus sp. CX]
MTDNTTLTTATDRPGRAGSADIDADVVVETSALTKRYGDRAAVDSVDMTVRRGEIYGFLGPNGAGKTTTLRMILGLIRPTSGSVRVLGRPAGSRESSSCTGALIEGPGFFPYLSGRANLRTLARHRGLSDRCVEEVLARVGLVDRGNDAYKSYSLGMKQRLGVAAALLGDPDLIVLDEPTNGLDPSGMADMRALIVDLARAGHTVILSSHLLGEVQEICDRVGVIANGRLVRESTVSTLLGDAILKVRGTPQDRVVSIASDLAGENGFEIDGDAVLLDLPPERAPDVVRALVAADVAVSSIGPTERTLEDVFFEMTTTSTPMKGV